jgi:PIN domain nuclease of toxin-antitoxin system
LLDTHALHWLTTDPDRLAADASSAIASADELVVAAPTWYELALLLTRGRVAARIPLRAWLDELGRGVRTLPMTPAIAARAVELPSTFPRDPADRIIFATALETGLRLVTRDRHMREHDSRGDVVVW